MGDTSDECLAIYFGHTGSDKFSTVLISNANETKRRQNE